MNFWDTVLGIRLAETLIRELPKLNDNLEKIIDIEYSNHPDEQLLDDAIECIKKVKATLVDDEEEE